jgi:leucyl-tRNA---protein transferase
MIIIQEPRFSYYGVCPYFKEARCRFEYFYARNLDGIELDELFNRGWRKFGTYYFRPECGRCRQCIPIRIMVPEFAPTKSQRRVLKKCAGIEVRLAEPEFRDEIFEIYRDHSFHRFGRESDLMEFLDAFYTPSCPSLQSEYYLGGELIAVGFIDVSQDSFSSVYFVYKTEYEQYRLGTYSIIKEVEHAASKGMKYYYLGYYIRESRSMSYKNHFHPNEKFDWINQVWTREREH